MAVATSQLSRSETRSTVGRSDEIRAWLWLSKLGFEVFKDITSNSLIDCIALDPMTGETILIEIRSAYREYGKEVEFYPAMSTEQLRLGVRLLLVIDGEECILPSRDEIEHRNRSYQHRKRPERAIRICQGCGREFNHRPRATHCTQKCKRLSQKRMNASAIQPETLIVVYDI